LTIIPSDNVVVIDGRAVVINLSNYTSLKGIHAIQWDGEKGHVEYDNSRSVDFRSNELIDGIESYRNVIEACKREIAAEDAKPASVPHDPTRTDEWAKRIKEMSNAK